MLLLLLQFIGCYAFPYVLPFMGLIVLFLVTVYWMLPFVLSSMASDFGLLFATVYRTLFFFFTCGLSCVGSDGIHFVTVYWMLCFLCLMCQYLQSLMVCKVPISTGLIVCKVPISMGSYGL